MNHRYYFNDPVTIDRLDVDTEPDAVSFSLMAPDSSIVMAAHFPNVGYPEPPKAEMDWEVLRRLADLLEGAAGADS